MIFKFIIYNDGTHNNEFRDLLKGNLGQGNLGECFRINVVNKTFHSNDREKERRMSEEQRETLAAISNGPSFLFPSRDVSEIRGLQFFGAFYVTGLVINDVAFAVHPKGLPKELIILGYGTAEGEGFAVIKTVLKYANRQPACHVDYVDGYKIVKDDNIHTFVFNNKKSK